MTDIPSHDPAYYLRRLVDHVPSQLVYWDADLRCRFANRAYEHWVGAEPDTLIGASLRDLLGPALFALNEPYIRAALAGAEQTFERLVPRRDGSSRHSLANYMPDIVDGKVIGFLVQVTEITQLKMTELALRESELFLDRTGRIAGVGGWEVDLRTRKVTWSAHTRRIHEVDDDHEPVFMGSERFYPPQAWALLSAAMQDAQRDGSAWDIEIPFVTAKGRPLWVRIFGEVECEDGAPVRLIGAFQDITEHRRHKAELLREQELRLESERHAQDLDRLLEERGQMLDVLAHEVRQPLNNASAALQSAAATLSELQETVASGRLLRAQVVLGQVLASIDNTLAVASLLARPDPIDPADTDIDTLLAVSIADMPAAERGRIVIERTTGTRTASMDMNLMRLALRNLLSNALRYSPQTKAVTVRIGDSDDPLALLIDVIDNGPGIAESAVPSLFERGAGRQHQQASSPHGMGLGLYIVRRVMELHGGRVDIAANGPDGATFRLEIALPADD